MSKTTRLDPMTKVKQRPGRGYWQHKGLSPKGDAILPNGKLVDISCDQRWGPRSKRWIKRLTSRLARRALNRVETGDE